MIKSRYKPLFFITLTWAYRAGRDDVEIEVRKYISRFARVYKGHIKKSVGIEWGNNTHAHIIIWSFDINPHRVKPQKVCSEKMFPHGGVDFEVYDQERYDYKAVFYTLKHQGINDADEVFCGGIKRSCVSGRCVERRLVADTNKRLRMIEMKKTG